MEQLFLISITVILGQCIYQYLKKYHRKTSYDVRLQFMIDIGYMALSSVIAIYLIRMTLRLLS